ncbi:8381_t:CDS:2 [Ambispora gerdemannii]|uniref:8381_t:CDS:1 n=1 Tax=Ambispora gerdemannii TaxID=144530 RepID=A0A9N8V9C4_9GLOM|nr:8381_t:CDS:2 [Ambispora gerdemannii]
MSTTPAVKNSNLNNSNNTNIIIKPVNSSQAQNQQDNMPRNIGKQEGSFIAPLPITQNIHYDHRRMFTTAPRRMESA